VRPEIAFNGSDFAVVWNGFKFLVIGTDGTPKTAIILSPTPGIEPVLDWTGATWQVGYSRAQMLGITMSSSGQPGEEKLVGGTTSQTADIVGSAFVGGTVGYVWENRANFSSPGTVYFARTDTAVATLGQGAITADPPPAGESNENPRIGVVGDHFGIAYRKVVNTAASIEYSERKLDGSPECGPLVLDATTSSYTSPYPQRIGKFGNRNSMLVMDGTGNQAKLALARLGDACTFLDTTQITSAYLDNPDRNGTWARGDKGHIIVWTAGSTATTRTLRARVFGPNLCDGPL
jgi:hypothetical protein